jgi:hypothetical protein
LNHTEHEELEMSKAQTDIRRTSYDARNANPSGYQGTLDDVIAQLRNAPDHGSDPSYTRHELIAFLGVNQSLPSAGPSVELDQNVRYGAEDVALGIFAPGFYGLANAKARGWL